MINGIKGFFKIQEYNGINITAIDIVRPIISRLKKSFNSRMKATKARLTFEKWDEKWDFWKMRLGLLKWEWDF